MDHARLVFLKLGGSLITDKSKPMTPKLDVIRRLADEIAQVIHADTNIRLLIGHGSGSFGHAVADRYQTRSGGTGAAYWQGFSEVWAAARELNDIVIKELTRSGLPLIAFPPSAAIITENQRVKSWDIRPIKVALSQGLIPVVYGDVVLDSNLGGTILSTEELFHYLAGVLHPDEILLAGLDKGVFNDLHQPEEIIPLISPQNIHAVLPSLSSSKAVDVTGGMLTKVSLMVSLVVENPALKVRIFSGQEPGNLHKALSGEKIPASTQIIHNLTP
jgi:isopentenyl phosphate kinase